MWLVFFPSKDRTKKIEIEMKPKTLGNLVMEFQKGEEEKKDQPIDVKDYPRKFNLYNEWYVRVELPPGEYL